MKLLIIFLAAWLGCAAAAQSQRDPGIVSTSGEKRVALVIGNSAYKDAPLRNPVNDARDMAATLRRLGFDVIEKTNVSQKDINRAIAQFGEKLRSDTVALFYYAGHGIQVKGKNYIIPIDAHITGEATVRAEAVDVDTVMDQLVISPMNIVILDACRNNPFERKFRSTGGGLAQMDAPKGSLIAYATAPGKTAADGDSRNGLYTQELLKHIQTPGLPLEAVFKRVRNGVMAASGDAQTPWEASSLTGDFFFRPVAGATTPATAQPVAAPVDLTAVEVSFWESIKNSTDAEDFQAYLDKYPGGQFVALAERRAKKKPVKADQPGTGPALPEVFRDCAECPEMVVIPAGGFEMGGLEKDQKPKHRVTLPGFALGKTEVTQGQWRALAGNNPSHFSTCGDDCPVESVKWEEAQDFVRKLSQKTGKTYRLPSEAEWEYACRAGGKHMHCGGDDLDALGWRNRSLFVEVHPVARKQPNAWGLHDMSANVWEWVEDCWNNNYDGAPGDGSAWKSGDCSEHVARGGGGGVHPSVPSAPLRLDVGSSYRDLGFRVARTLGQESTQPVETARSDAAKSESLVASRNLEWAASDNGADISWNDARSYCADQGSNWRLPSVAELQASYQSGHSTPCDSYTCKFTSKSRLTSWRFWSSELHGSSEVWLFSLWDGTRYVRHAGDRSSNRVLCVRQP